MNFVTCHPTISPKLTLFGRFGLLGFDFEENIFLSDLPHLFISFPVSGWIRKSSSDSGLTGGIGTVGGSHP